MTPRHLRKSAFQLAVLYVLGLLLAYAFETPREIIQQYWVWFTLPLVILLAVAAFSNTRFVERVLLWFTPERIRKLVWYLAVIYIVVVVAIYLWRPDLRSYVLENWLRLLLPIVGLAIVAWLARPRALERLLKVMAPGRLRKWLIQIAILFVIVTLVAYWLNWSARLYIREYWVWFFVILAVLLFFAFLARPRGLELYKEYPEPDEQETIDKIIDLLLGELKKIYDGRLVLRDTHPKSNGLLFARFEVLSDLPEQYRVGLFKEPRTYNCWMRFSNSEPEVTPDHQPDFRGIALKLFEVEGDKLQDDEQGTVDFLFIAHDAFFAATPKDFFAFFNRLFGLREMFGARIAQLFYFFPKRLRLLRNALIGRRSYGHPFEINWFSCAPFKFGDRVVKYKLQSIWPKSEPDRGNPNYLRERLTATLAQRGHTMDFMVQFQEDPNRDLIETTAIPWRVPQFRTVARLHIPEQNFNSPNHLQFDEDMTFNPWHCLPEHRPVGGINRARRDVMRAIQEFRLAQNERQRTDVTREYPDDAPQL